MADKKISQLTDLPAASVSPSNDVLAIVDTNVTETKKITAKALVDGALNAGTANGLVYLNGSKEATTGSIITYDGTTFKVDDAVVINESGGDNDTRIEGDTDANLFFVDASTDRVGIGTSSPSNKLTVSGNADVTGNLGIGTASPSSFSGYTTVSVNNATNGGIYNILVNGTETARLQAFSGAFTVAAKGASTNLLFETNGAERARITAGGDLLVGTTSTTPNPGVAIFASGGIGQGNSAGASGFEFHSFRRSAVQIGSITQNGTTAVAYNTSSDRRLKENIVPAPDAGAKIDAIEIVSHDWKSTPDEHVEFGVVAQDLALIAPQAVTAGDESEEIENTWGVDYSKLVPMLIKEVQSLRKRVAELEAK